MNAEELLIADKEYRRLDLCLSEMTELSRSRAQSLIEEGLVSVNGRPCRRSDVVRLGDTVRYTVPEAKPIELVPEDIPLDIVYEDEDICVVNKPRGMVVHPAVGNESGTLVNALLYHFGDLSSIGGEIRPGIVHRIDKMTSGLLVVAKNDAAHERLARQFADHSAHRSYIALVAGNIREGSGAGDGADPSDPRSYGPHPSSGGGGPGLFQRQKCPGHGGAGPSRLAAATDASGDGRAHVLRGAFAGGHAARAEAAGVSR